MLAFIGWLILIFLLGASLFYRWPNKIVLVVFFIFLFFYTYFNLFSLTSLIILWILWLVSAIFLWISPLRYQFFTRRFIKWFQQQQPELDRVEKEVLAAGGLWFEQEFFKDKPNWSHLFSLSKPILSREEQHFLDHQAQTLCDKLNQWEYIHAHNNFPPDVWDYIKNEKFWGLEVDKKYGGHGFSPLAHSAIITKIASKNYSAALTVMVPNSVGPAELILHYGTEDQKNYYLPKLVNGEEIACFALTSPYAGSDASNLVDLGIICKGIFEGKETVGIRLNWTKRYITLGPIATLIGLAFHLIDPDHLLGEKENIGITLALIPSHLSGIKMGERHNPLHLNFLNGPIQGKDVFIPLDFVIGGKDRCGKGWQILMECLCVGRGISLPAVSSAITQLCFRTSGAYAFVREQFARSIGSFEGVKEALARIAGFHYICEASKLFTTFAVQSGARPAIASAITKYHLTEFSSQVVKYAMDIHGGRGIQLGPRNYLGDYHCASPINITVEGANILTRNLIIFGQGALRCHQYLRHEIMASQHPEDSDQIKIFDKLILSHVGFLFSQTLKTILYGLSGGRFIKVPGKGILKKYQQQFSRMSAAFNMATDITFVLIGKKIKIQEALSARLGDVLSHLYLGSAVMKYFYDNGSKETEEAFLTWSLDYCLYQIEEAFIKFCDNFPTLGVGKLMLKFIFPWGRAYYFPKDKNSFLLADFMQTPSLERNRLTTFFYSSQNPEDPVFRLENAWRQLWNVQNLFHKISAHYPMKIRLSKLAKTIQNAYNDGIITMSERDQLVEVDKLLRDVIEVDEFDWQPEK